MNYGIPTFKLEGNLVHYAAYKHHIGFYPDAAGIAHFEKDFVNYKSSKGAVQFPIDEEMPWDLIKRIVEYRIQQNLEKADLKKKPKSTNKTCKNGHPFTKTSECPVCPICAKESKPKSGFMSTLAAPARRALENAGIKTIKQLAKYSETDILTLHGMGKSSIPKLKDALTEAGLQFKNK
jgi:predicted RecB family nuclease